MREVAIIGIGQTTVDEHWDKSIRILAGEAIISALTDAGRDKVDGLFVGNMLSGMISKQEHLGTIIADWIGHPGIEAYKVEAACGSGAAAFRLGMMAVSSGELDSAVVVGVEKMTEGVPIETTEALVTASDADYEAAQGLSFVALNALIMRRYMYQYHWEHRHFAQFSINSHNNALHNPYARLHDVIDEDDYDVARMVAEPINLLDASPIGDGAAAVIIVPRDSLTNIRKKIVTVAGSSSATDTLSIQNRHAPLRLAAAEKSALKAYNQAGISVNDISFFEVHDAFSIMSALSLEACGFADEGQGPRLAEDHEITMTGQIPICTQGGLKARGHPVGATGIYQIVEAVLQLRGEAGPNQIPEARIGMTQNIGGSGATIITNILKVG